MGRRFVAPQLAVYRLLLTVCSTIQYSRHDFPAVCRSLFAVCSLHSRFTIHGFFLILAFALLAGNSANATALIERNLAYGSDTKQRLDLSLPDGRMFPTVVFIHGGSLTGDDKADENYRNVCIPFAEAGIACANVNYRLAPAHSWPAQIEDVAAAIAWIRNNIRARRGDPNKLFIMGHSSGAMLAALVGSDEHFLKAQGIKMSEIRGVIPMGSIMWDDDLQEAIDKYGRARVEEAYKKRADRIFSGLDDYLNHWPIRHLGAGMPPFLFLIAESEQENPPVLQTNKKFVEDARALGNRADYKVLPNRTHYSAIRNLDMPDDEVFKLVLEFIRQLSSDALNKNGKQ